MFRKIKRVHFFVVAVCFLFLGCSADSSDGGVQAFGSTELNRFISGLMHGWNLGNTLDAQSWGEGSDNLGLETETSWGMPLTTKSMIAAVSAKGFRTIRVPVSWHNHIIERDGYKIDPEWMERVQTIVDWALECNMNVIINIHHDNTSDNGLDVNGGFSISSNDGVKAVSISYITSIWKQVAEHFADYDQRLIFEVLNEPRIIGNDGKEQWNPSGSTLEWANKLIVQYEQSAVAAIRKSGGNNGSRYIMCAPYAASPYNLSGWQLPVDSAFQKLIVSVHAYSPYSFCMDRGDNNKFTDSIESELSWLFNSLNTSFVSQGIPVVMGEASASDKENTAERVKWTRSYFRNAKKNSVPVLLWDNMVTVGTGGNINSGECHGYFNRKKCTWYFEDIIAAIMQNR